MSDHERDEMIRENERMKTALKSIEQYATNAQTSECGDTSL
jgi:hypothetical protein